MIQLLHVAVETLLSQPRLLVVLLLSVPLLVCFSLLEGLHLLLVGLGALVPGVGSARAATVNPLFVVTDARKSLKFVNQ